MERCCISRSGPSESRLTLLAECHLWAFGWASIGVDLAAVPGLSGVHALCLDIQHCSEIEINSLACGKSLVLRFDILAMGIVSFVKASNTAAL